MTIKHVSVRLPTKSMADPTTVRVTLTAESLPLEVSLNSVETSLMLTRVCRTGYAKQVRERQKETNPFAMVNGKKHCQPTNRL